MKSTPEHSARTGTILTLSDPSVAEMLSAAGYDWLMADMEHSALSLDQTRQILQAVRPGCFTVVRIPANEDLWIKRILDLGCQGIMVPMVRKGNEAYEAIRSAKYPPAGRRSVGICRAQGYGLSFEQYLGRANEEVKILLQIEHIQGVMNLDEILSVDGIDGIFIGPYDLSASMNLTGQVQHPEVVDVISGISNACQEKGISWGIFSADAASLSEYRKAGAKWLLHSIDILHLSKSARQDLQIIKE